MPEIPGIHWQSGNARWRWALIRRNRRGTPQGGRVNRTMPPRGGGGRGSTAGRPSRRGRAQSGAGRLVGGTEAAAPETQLLNYRRARARSAMARMTHLASVGATWAAYGAIAALRAAW